LQGRFKESFLKRDRWQTERARGNWPEVELGTSGLPKFRDFLSQQIGGLDKLFKRPPKKENKE
jgi:hypothetical protein